MNQSISIHAHPNTCTQLRDFAKTFNLTLANALSVLLDHAARTGLGMFTMPGFNIEVECGVVTLQLDDFAVPPMSAADSRAIAGELRHTAGTSACLNEVIIEIAGKSGAALRKTVTCGVARAVAARLEVAANEADADAE